ncbi:hypothetical protein BD413DRAFT_455543, partial [Trametes elegans]
LYAPTVSQTFQSVIPDNFTECTPAVIRWIGGARPYELDLIAGGHPGAVTLQRFPQLQGMSFTWPANQRADGTFYTFRLFDATGAIAQSSQFRMQLGTDRSCLDVVQTTPGPTTEVASEPATQQSTQPSAAPTSSPLSG